MEADIAKAHQYDEASKEAFAALELEGVALDAI
jgi:hypothetical protein